MFGYRIIGSVTLTDLQTEILQYLPQFFKESKSNSCLNVQNVDIDVISEIKEEIFFQPEIQEDDVKNTELDDKENENISIEESFDNDPVSNIDNDFDNDSTAKDNSFYCQLCKKSFATSLKLYYHKRVHRPKKFEPSRCEICNKDYETKQQLIHHRSKFHKVIYILYYIYGLFIPKRIAQFYKSLYKKILNIISLVKSSFFYINLL